MTCVPSSLQDSRPEGREERMFEAASAARNQTDGLEQQEQEQEEEVGRKVRKRILPAAETLTLRMRKLMMRHKITVSRM